MGRPKELLRFVSENSMDFNELLRTNHNASKATAVRSDNTSGVPGVWRCGNRWRAEIRVYGRKRSLGSFETKQEAIDARKRAEDQLG